MIDEVDHLKWMEKLRPVVSFDSVIERIAPVGLDDALFEITEGVRLFV